MLYWGCSKQTVNERGDFDGIARLHRLNLPDVKPTLLKLLKSYTISEQFDDKRMSRMWHTAVTAYTRLKLTYSSDRLPALQGIARSMHQERKCAYYAGLWEDTLLRDAMWWRSRDPPLAQDSKSQAPSWSWASAIGPVKWPQGLWSDTYRPTAKTVSVETHPVGKDSMGEVAGGTLVLPGHCAPALIPHDGTKGPSEMHAIRFKQAGALWHLDSDDKTGLDLDKLTLVTMGEDTHNSWVLILTESNAGYQTFRRFGCGRLGHLMYRHELNIMGETKTITIVRARVDNNKHEQWGSSIHL
jgi:hypothetical protein